ncbi:MAG: type IV pilus assembly protein PilM [Epulopiscium sp.]|jgi:type IV pilus assembly protein PilM|nr:type IV pilus assembly protein PilM [Candidatus Epulonipiscium sp.]
MGQLLGIEVGNSNIKLVQGIKKGRIVHVQNHGITATPKNAVRDGFIVDMEAVYNAASELIKKKRFNEQNAALSIQGTSIITRDVIVPYMEENELRNVLEYQKEEYFPIDVSDYQTDFKILEKLDTDEGKKLSVLLVAAPNNMITGAMDLLRRLNLKVKFIDIASNAVANLYANKSMSFQGEEPYSIMVLDIGGQTTTATIISDGKILFSRTILYGFDELNDIISKEFSEESYEQVEIFKKRYAAIYDADKSPEEDLYGSHISHVIKPAIDTNLIQEISRVLDFYYSRNNARKVKTIYLVGGGACLKNFDRYIGKSFGINTVRGDILDNIKAKDALNFKEDFLYLTNVLGLITRIS